MVRKETLILGKTNKIQILLKYIKKNKVKWLGYEDETKTDTKCK